MMPNHHITKPVLIGEIEGNGQFNIVSQTPGLIVAQAWSPYLEGSKDLISDWLPPMSCGNFNVKSRASAAVPGRAEDEGKARGAAPGPCANDGRPFGQTW